MLKIGLLTLATSLLTANAFAVYQNKTSLSCKTSETSYFIHEYRSRSGGFTRASLTTVTKHNKMTKEVVDFYPNKIIPLEGLSYGYSRIENGITEYIRINRTIDSEDKKGIIIYIDRSNGVTALSQVSIKAKCQ